MVRARAAEPAQLGAAPDAEHQQRQPGPLHLGTAVREQLLGGLRVDPEHRRHLQRGEPVTQRQFQRLTLLGGGAGRLRPGQLAQPRRVTAARRRRVSRALG